MLVDDPEKNARVASRLGEEPVVWLTTVRADGQPQSTPVWFLWDGDHELVMYSEPNKPKLRNIGSNPKVSLHFNDHAGSDVVALEGAASIVGDVPPVSANHPYVEKYRELIADLGADPDSFAAMYSVAVRIRITNARAPF